MNLVIVARGEVWPSQAPYPSKAQRVKTRRGRDGLRHLGPMLSCDYVLLLAEVEQIEQVPDCRAIRGDVGIGLGGLRIWEIITAPVAHWAKIPVSLDEFENRNMIGIFMRDVSWTGELRGNKEGDPRAV